MNVLVAKADVELERHPSGRREPGRRPDDMRHDDRIVETASLPFSIEPAEGAGDLRRGRLGQVQPGAVGSNALEADRTGRYGPVELLEQRFREHKPCEGSLSRRRKATLGYLL